MRQFCGTQVTYTHACMYTQELLSALLDADNIGLTDARLITDVGLIDGGPS